jgi:PEP-CTERM motif
VTHGNRIVSLGAISAAAFAFGTFGVMPQAHATLQIFGVNNGANLICVDNTACDGNPAVGTLFLGGTILSGGILINGSLSTSALNLDILNSSSLAVINTNPTAVSITVSLGDMNFVGPANRFAFSGSGTFQNATGGTITDTWWDDPANAQPAGTSTDRPGNLLGTGSHTSTTLPLDSFAFNQAPTALAAPDTGPFSMTLGFDITLPAGNAACIAGNLAACPQLISRGQTVSKSLVVAVPEPTSLLIIGAGLLGMGLVHRWKR